MSGGNFSLKGGFWSLIAIQTPGAPLLRVVPTSTNTVIVAWPAPSTGFSLQQIAVLGTTNWSGVTNSQTVVGSENQVVIPLPAADRFYRLKSP